MKRSEAGRRWKDDLRDMFSVHEGERRGITVLLTLCMSAMAWVVYAQWIAPHPVDDAAAIAIAWKQVSAADGSSIRADQRSDRQEAMAPERVFPFDPNHLSIDRWQALGLTQRQAEAIHHFEEKGGHFRTKQDLRRMRVIDPSLFAKWEAYIQLPDTLPLAHRSDSTLRSAPDRDVAERPAPSTGREHVRQPLLEINSADTNQLIAVPGIGPAFARAIVRYRERLGGFHDLDQLKEVYILRDKPEAVARLQDRFVVDTLLMRRCPLNSFDAEALGPHPYAGWKVAKALVAYRKQHGPFRSVGDIRGCVLVTDSLYRKLAPYLSTE